MSHVNDDVLSWISAFQKNYASIIFLIFTIMIVISNKQIQCLDVTFRICEVLCLDRGCCTDLCLRSSYIYCFFVFLNHFIYTGKYNLAIGQFSLTTSYSYNIRNIDQFDIVWIDVRSGTMWTYIHPLSRYYIDMCLPSWYCVDLCPLRNYCVERFCWFLAVSLINYTDTYDLIYQPLSRQNNLSHIFNFI